MSPPLLGVKRTTHRAFWSCASVIAVLLRAPYRPAHGSLYYSYRTGAFWSGYAYYPRTRQLRSQIYLALNSLQCIQQIMDINHPMVALVIEVPSPRGLALSSQISILLP